jgi:hypothetical protein
MLSNLQTDALVLLALGWALTLYFLNVLAGQVAKLEQEVRHVEWLHQPPTQHRHGAGSRLD